MAGRQPTQPAETDRPFGPGRPGAPFPRDVAARAVRLLPVLLILALPAAAPAQTASPPLPPPRPETFGPAAPRPEPFGPDRPPHAIQGPPMPAPPAPAAEGPPAPPPRPDAAPAAPAPEAKPPESKPPESKPAEAAPQAPAAPPGPDCLTRLRDRGLAAETATVPADPDNPACTIDTPVTLTAMSLPGGRVELPDRPTIACTTAETFADFLSGFMAPLAKGTYGDTIVSVGTGPGFECRPRDGVKGAKLSAHGQGLAIDVAQFRLSGGRTYHVGDFADERDRVFDRAFRAGACGYFHTALGPGADASHATHWHMDLEPRGTSGTSRFCQ
ncbi:extensin family protein [Labrys monachus]|uniref:Extensin-like C-terminal domain-containing protein n=1 Tax=Labrys monachus TaxID=217067 RepID=A0ABU0FMN7_9HYPH|nr:extensin family protein [Labrys monachus]MDQ0395870.1 hypothetical protein [Labrys monachus]